MTMVSQDFLARLVDSGVVTTGRAAELSAHVPPPWWLTLLQGIAAWFAALFIISTFFAPLLLLGEGPLGRGISGLALLVIALWLFRKPHVFTAQMALALSLAGQALVVFAVAGDLEFELMSLKVVWAVGGLLAAGMLVPPSTALHRTVCGLIALGYLGLLIDVGNGLVVYSLLLATMSVAGWLTRTDWAASPVTRYIRPLLHAVTLGALLAGWLVGVEAARDAVIAAASEGRSPRILPGLYPAGISMLLVATVAWLNRRADLALRSLMLAGAVVLVGMAWQAPGLLLSAALLLAVFHACHLPWMALALLASGLFLGELYYSLHVTLLVKSAVLAATGLLLLALRAAIARLRGGQA